jgi:hypothetical protein
MGKDRQSEDKQDGTKEKERENSTKKERVRETDCHRYTIIERQNVRQTELSRDIKIQNDERNV